MIFSKSKPTRDRDGINKTFSGLMKIIFLHGGASKQEVEDLLKYAVEGRKRVKDQLMRIDSTYAAVGFSYFDKTGRAKPVTTLILLGPAIQNLTR
jgi:ATP-dependent Lon protease